MRDQTAWTCPICGERYVVPSRAKDCEAKCREIVWVESGRANGGTHG